MKEILYESYVNWRVITEEVIKESGLSGSIDCGESSVREDFSFFLSQNRNIELYNQKEENINIPFETMQKLEERYNTEGFDKEIKPNYLKINFYFNENGKLEKADTINKLEKFSQGKVNTEGSREGEWKFYNEKKELIQEGNYKEGQQEGLWKKYSKGNLIREENYKNGKLDGIAKDYSLKTYQIYKEMEYKNGVREGFFRDYWDNGNIKEEGILDKHFRKQGIWKEYNYHKNGKLDSESNYIDGKARGTQKIYRDNNIEVWNQVKNGHRANVTLYDLKYNKLNEVESIVNTEKNGKYKEYYENGNLKMEGEYKNGKEEGIWRTYNEKGFLREEAKYRDGKLDGTYKKYEYGIILVEENYKENKLDGLCKYNLLGGSLSTERNYKNGKLLSEGQYKNTEREGEWKFYDEDGKISHEENYKNGKLHGINKCYLNENLCSVNGYENGILKFEIYIKQQENIYKEYYPNENLKAEGNYKNGNKEGKWKTYHSNGQLSSEGQYQEGKREGEWKFYYENRQLKAEGQYQNGNMGGIWKHYHANGQLWEEAKWENSNMEGYCKRYNIEGQLSSEGQYKNNKTEGLWKFYNGFGQLEKEVTYKAGVEVKQEQQQDQSKGWGARASQKSGLGHGE